METNKIYNLKYIQDLLNELNKLEDDRIYCRHDLNHFLSTARICYILCLENNLNISKDIIYSTALLHDLGRICQYKTGIPHDEASVEIAKKALQSTNYSEHEKNTILSAINSHRIKSDDISFEALFYKADKLSRDCFNCKVSDCNWNDEKKNLEIKY